MNYNLGTIIYRKSLVASTQLPHRQGLMHEQFQDRKRQRPEEISSTSSYPETVSLLPTRTKVTDYCGLLGYVTVINIDLGPNFVNSCEDIHLHRYTVLKIDKLYRVVISINLSTLAA